MLREALTYRIRGCVYEVYRELGHGFLERVYQKALLLELRNQGLEAKAQTPMSVAYKEKVVGEYFADLLVEETVILELKAQRHLKREAESQLLNYLRGSGLQLGLLINFTYPRATVKRLVP